MIQYFTKAIKYIIKLFIPQKIIFLFNTANVYWYDIKRYTNNSNTHYRLDSPDKMKGKLTMQYHVIEKGLTMPTTRFEFGKAIIFDTIALCKTYLKNNYDPKDPVFTHCVEVLNEYLRFHRLNNYNIDASLTDKINELSAMTNIDTISNQYKFSADEFFQDNKSSFDKFCKSRHSLRNFTNKNVPIETIHECIDLALQSPSACNRQPNRVYIIKNRQKILEVLKLQNGNRGFGHLADTILVVSSDISVFQSNHERNEPMLNSGLFIMTLIYALHFHKIGACLLNWSACRENDQQLRNEIEVPDNEVIALIIAIGYVPDKFKIACSPKLKATEITHEVI